METAVSEFTCTWHYKEWVELLGVILLVIVYPGLEYWFGKTNKTKAGSLLEFLLLLGKSILGTKPKQLLLAGHVQPQEESMLEGREFEKEIGKGLGTVFVDVKEDLTVEAGMTFNGRKGLEDLAASTNKAWLRTGIGFVLSMFGNQAKVASADVAPAAAEEPKAQA